MKIISTRKIFINTRSNLVTINNYPYFSDITFNIGMTIELLNENNNFLINLSDCVVPISIYKISEYFNNNILYYSVNNVDYNYTIPDGNYSIYDLKTELTGNLNGIVINYSTITNKLTFTHSTYDFTFDFTQSGNFQEFGFYENIIYSSSSFSLISVIPIDLSGSREIYIHSNLSVLNINSLNGNLTSHVIDHIPINIVSNDILKYSNNTNFKTKITNNKIDNIEIILRDDENFKLPLLHHWSITLELTEIENKPINITIKDNEFYDKK